MKEQLKNSMEIDWKEPLDCWMMEEDGIEALKGSTIVAIDGMRDGSEMVRFMADDGRQWAMYHQNPELDPTHVCLVDVCGYPDALLGRPIMVAEERTSVGRNECGKWEGDYPPQPSSGESYKWTFYELSTVKGSVTLRWFGTSSGYYSESVSVVQTRREE